MNRNHTNATAGDGDGVELYGGGAEVSGIVEAPHQLGRQQQATKVHLPSSSCSSLRCHVLLAGHRLSFFSKQFQFFGNSLEMGKGRLKGHFFRTSRETELEEGKDVLPAHCRIGHLFDMVGQGDCTHAIRD